MHVFHSKASKRITALAIAIAMGAGATGVFAYLVAPAGGQSTLACAGQVTSQPTQAIALTEVGGATYTQGAGAGFTKIGDTESMMLKAVNNGTLPTILNSVTLVSWTSSAGTACDTAVGVGSFVASPLTPGLSLNSGASNTNVGPLVITFTDTGVNQSCLEGSTITYVLSAS